MELTVHLGSCFAQFEKNSPGDLVNQPTLKDDNVKDCILPEFITLTELLLDIDAGKDIYCGLEAGNERQKKHAQRIMESDPLIPKELHSKNVIESVSGICNVYSKERNGNMLVGVPGQNKSPEKNIKTRQETMKDKFANWKIDLKWVILFPHVDDFNSRHSGQNFLGSVSRTVAKEGSSMDSSVGYVTMVRQTLNFCQCKVLEDAVVHEDCARTI